MEAVKHAVTPPCLEMAPRPLRQTPPIYRHYTSYIVEEDHAHADLASHP